MLFHYYDYLYDEFYINYFNGCYLIKYSTQCKKIEINIMKFEMYFTITNKNESNEKNFYLLFSGLKNYICNK